MIQKHLTTGEELLQEEAWQQGGPEGAQERVREPHHRAHQPLPRPDGARPGHPDHREQPLPIASLRAQGKSWSTVYTTLNLMNVSGIVIVGWHQSFRILLYFEDCVGLSVHSKMV